MLLRASVILSRGGGVVCSRGGFSNFKGGVLQFFGGVSNFSGGVSGPRWSPIFFEGGVSKFFFLFFQFFFNFFSQKFLLGCTPPPRRSMRCRYAAFYWNAFLFFTALASHVCFHCYNINCLASICEHLLFLIIIFGFMEKGQ